MLADMVRRATTIKPADFVDASQKPSSFGALHFVFSSPATIQANDHIFIAACLYPDYIDGSSSCVAGMPLDITGSPVDAGYTKLQDITVSGSGKCYLFYKEAVSGDASKNIKVDTSDLTAGGFIMFVYRPSKPGSSPVSSVHWGFNSMTADSITTTNRKKRVVELWMGASQLSQSVTFSSLPSGRTNRASKLGPDYSYLSLNDYVKDGAGATGNQTGTINPGTGLHNGCAFQIQV